MAALTAAGHRPGLGTLLVGDDPGSRWYVNAKHSDCAQVGIASIQRELPATATLKPTSSPSSRSSTPTRRAPATSSSCPCRRGIEESTVLEAMDPAKDADGLHPVNLGRLVLNVPGPLPCTPVGIVELLRRFDVPIAGAEVVVVGRGITVGRPLGLLLTRRTENATVTLCHTGTRDLAAHVRNADIVVAAAGVPGLITADIVKPGAAVLDVGVSRVDGKIAGDVALDVLDVAGFVAPNPGGVGPDDPGHAAAERRPRRRAGRGARGAQRLSMTRPPLYVRRPFLAGLRPPAAAARGAGRRGGRAAAW